MAKVETSNDKTEIRLSLELHVEFARELELFNNNYNNDDERNKLVKSFCKLLKYHIESVRPALNKVEYFMSKQEKINYDVSVNLNNFVDYFIVVLAKEGVWIDQTICGVRHNGIINLKEHIDPKLRKWTYDINGSLINYQEPKKTK